MNDMLLIIGASGHGKVIADIAIKMNKWQNIVFLDDDKSIKKLMDFEVIGTIADAPQYKDKADFFVAIGNNESREKIQEKLLDDGLSMVTLIHPSAIIASDVEIGIGTAIMAGVIINAATSIGKGCIINTGAIVEHDNVIEDYVHISPRVSTAGNVKIGKNTWLGIGSVVSNNVSICHSAIIGAGATVIDNICHGGGICGYSSKKDIIIIGAGGFGQEVAYLIEDINKASPEWNIIGFVDDNPSIQGSIINGYKVMGDTNWLKKQEIHVVNAIGNPIAKKKIIDKIKGSKNKYPVLIHPSVTYSDSVSFGEGSIICAGSIITVNVEIGRHVIINLDSTIGHNASIGDYTTILPSVNVSGFVKTEQCVTIGTGAAIIQGINIGENAIIGAGAVLVKDIPANCTAVGVPARPVKFRG